MKLLSLTDTTCPGSGADVFSNSLIWILLQWLSYILSISHSSKLCIVWDLSIHVHLVRWAPKTETEILKMQECGTVTVTYLCVLCCSVSHLEALSQLAVILLYIQGRSDVRAAKFNSCHSSCRLFSRRSTACLYTTHIQIHSGEGYLDPSFSSGIKSIQSSTYTFRYF